MFFSFLLKEQNVKVSITVDPRVLCSCVILEKTSKRANVTDGSVHLM